MKFSLALQCWQKIMKECQLSKDFNVCEDKDK